ncbi:MAG: hypothetical protein AAF988_05790 [Pseudomonadota bacterium]
MTRFYLIFLFSFVLGQPALAQGEATQTEQKTSIEAADNSIAGTDFDKRLELSKQMHEVWPIRPKIEQALDSIAAQINPQNRLRFKSAMRKAINFQSVETASVEAMADIFSEAELEAMIAFYGSKEGRSVSFKTDDYERALQPLLTKMLDKALLDTKLGQ